MVSQEKFAEVCGIHAGDGWMSKYNYEVGYGTAIYEVPYFIYVVKLYQQFFDMKFTRILWRKCVELRIQSKKSQQILQDAGFPRGKKLDNLHIPDFIKNKPKLLKPFIRGLVDTDGHAYWRKNQYGQQSLVITLTTTSKPFAKEICNALTFLGYRAQLFHYEYSKLNGRRNVFKITIMRRDCVKKYLEEIGFSNIRRWQKVVSCEEIFSKYAISKKMATFLNGLKVNRRQEPVV